MEENKNTLSIFGRKVFFIAPNLEYMPESYLQTFLSQGYECFAIKADASFSLQNKIEVIVALFPQSLLIFDTTSTVPGLSWEPYIQSLQKSHGKDVIISVVYSKKLPLAEKTRIKSFYTSTAKIEGGYMGLEPAAAKNLERLGRILTKCQAGGRRKTVRVNCDSQSSVTFTARGQHYRGRLIDISISHCSFDLEADVTPLPVYEKLQSAALLINGVQYVSDAVLILRRENDEAARWICMFTHGPEGLPGLQPEIQEKLAPQIYAMISASCAATLKKAYKTKTQ